MGFLRRNKGQQDRQPVQEMTLDRSGRTTAPLSQDGIGAIVSGDLPKGFRPSETVSRQEVAPVAFLRGLHAPDCAPVDLSSETGKRRRKAAKNCGNSADAHDRRLWKLLVAFWRRRFPKKTAEQIAARHGVSVRVAYEWLSGKLPPIWHFARMIAVEGSDFLREVIHKLAKHDDGKSRFRVRVPVLRRQTQGA